MRLSDEERAEAGGAEGEAVALALRILTQLGDLVGAERFLPISRAHIDGCLWHGQVNVDLAQRFVELGGRVRVPTTLNVGILDLLHPDRVRGEPRLIEGGRELARLHRELGCRETWTCAPYLLPDPPGLGEQIAWGESNAIVYANSVLGARTERYGDFTDLCAAISGRALAVGLHTDAGRRARLLVELPPLPEGEELVFPLVGYALGRIAGSTVACLTGLPTATDDDLRTLGAGAASSGPVALFHVLGRTPEAATLADAFGGCEPERVVRVTLDDLRAAREALGGIAGGTVAGVSVGTPHASLAECKRLCALLGDGEPVRVPFYLSTGRGTAATLATSGLDETLERAGVTIVTDTCTYLAPTILDAGRPGTWLTTSAKWAAYAPANVGVRPGLATLSECVRSARSGTLERAAGWLDG